MNAADGRKRQRAVMGNLDAYLASPLRVLTVGLNPSLHEFPDDEPFRRFPLVGDGGDREPGH